MHAYIYCAIYHARNITPHPINHHRIPIVNGVAQSVVLADAHAVSLAAGAYHSMMLKSNGDVWATGRNNYGQLGDGLTDAKTTVFVDVDFVKGKSACDMSL